MTGRLLAAARWLRSLHDRAVGLLADLLPDLRRSTEKCDQCGQPWLFCVCGYPAKSPAQPAANSAGKEPGLDLVASGPVTATPAPRGAVRAGQAPDPGGAPVPPEAALEPATPARAATLPRPVAALPAAAAGPGQPSRAWPRVTLLGTGALAVVTAPRVSLRVTGAQAAVPAPDWPLVPRYYRAWEAWRDAAFAVIA